MIVCAATLVPEVSSNREPRGAVSGSSPRNRVRDLVQEHLVDIVIRSSKGEVSGNSNSSFSVITGSEPSPGMVKAETPRLIEVQSNNGVCPNSHTVKLRHGFRVKGELIPAGQLSTVSEDWLGRNESTTQLRRRRRCVIGHDGDTGDELGQFLSRQCGRRVRAEADTV